MLSFNRNGFRARARWLAPALVLALGVGCSGGDGPATDFGDNDPSLVVALGDSITFGTHDMGIDSCSESYRSTIGFCPRLQVLTGKTVINEGRCGEGSSGGLGRIERVLRRYRPGVVLIDYSPNDLFGGSEATVANLRAMVAAARANKTVPILGTLVPAVGSHAGWEPFIQAVNAKIRVFCEEEGLPYADHYKAFVGYPGFTQAPYSILDADGLHPNSAGYALMAETWREPLMRLY